MKALLLSFVIFALTSCGPNSPLAAHIKDHLSDGDNSGTSQNAGLTITVSENVAVADATGPNSSGVVGEQNVLIGSFVINAGVGEGADIYEIWMTDDVGIQSGQSLATVFQNLRLESGGPADANGNYAAGTSIGITKGSLTNTENTRYHFFPSPAIKLFAGAQLVVNVYADVLNSADASVVNSDDDGIIYPSTVGAYGTDTGNSANGTMSRGLQNVFIAQQGELRVEAPATSAQVWTRIVAAGEQDAELFRFKVGADNEDVDITRFVICHSIEAEEHGATTALGKPLATFRNYKLWDGDVLLSGPQGWAHVYDESHAVDNFVDFNLGTANAYRVRRGEERTLTVTARANNWPGMSSGSVHRLYIHPNPFPDGTPAITARGVGSSQDLSGPDQEIVGNPIVVRRSYPLVQRLDLRSTTLSGGATSQKTIAKWLVSAVGGMVGLKKLTFWSAWNDNTLSTEMEISNIKLYRNGSLLGRFEYIIYDGFGTEPENILSSGGEGVLRPSNYGGLNTSYIKMVLVFGDPSTDEFEGEELIDGGTMNIYELKADIVNAHVGASTDSDGVSVTLLGDDEEIHPTTGVLAWHGDGVVGVRMRFGLERNFNFVWSDRSSDTGDHSSSLLSDGGSDWANGRFIPTSDNHQSFLPLDSWALSK